MRLAAKLIGCNVDSQSDSLPKDSVPLWSAFYYFSKKLAISKSILLNCHADDKYHDMQG